MSVGRLGSERLAEVIERPAQRAGLTFEPGLVLRMIEEIAGGSSSGGDPLPLLAFLLRRLYDDRSDPTMVTWQDYKRVGGVTGALKATADGVYEQLTLRGKRDLVVPTLLELAHAEPDHEPSSRAVPRSRFGPEEWEVIEAFVEEACSQPTATSQSCTWPTTPCCANGRYSSMRSRTSLTSSSRAVGSDVTLAIGSSANATGPYLLGGKRLEDAVAAVASPRWAPEPLVEEFVASSGDRLGGRGGAGAH